MSTLAKVFVVLNLILAVAFCFMTLTLYSKRTDFKDRWETTTRTLAKTKDLMQKEIDDWKEKWNASDRELTSKKQSLKDLASTLKRQEIEIKEQKDELNKAKETIVANEILIDKQRKELDRRHSQIDEMHKIIQNQQRALTVSKENEQQARRGKIDMENQLNTKIQQYKDLAKEKRKVETELAHQNAILGSLRDHGVPIERIVFGELGIGADIVKGPPIHAKVLAVDNAVNLVMLSVGQDDGVRKGYQFTVYRKDEYIGKVLVERTFRDMCSARIILPDLAQGKTIKENDNAATRVY